MIMLFDHEATYPKTTSNCCEDMSNVKQTKDFSKHKNIYEIRY